MSSTCARGGLVEANADGRLGAAERASLERHLRGCAECRELAEELARIRRTLASSTSEITPLAHQRARLSLLRAATAPPKKQRPTLLVAAAVLLAPVAVWAGISAVAAPREAKTLTSSTLVVDDATTVFEPPPVVPHVPPTFEVEAPKAPPPASAVRETLSPASRDFNAAMQAIANGDFGAGATQLERFIGQYPNDPRVEEAMYLDAIALERAGRTADAKSAARRYLDAYPDGAHRTRAAKLAD